MARNKVICTDMIKVERDSPNTEFLGWGRVQVRKAKNHIKSDKLKKYHSCIAGKMAGASGSLKDIQEKFRASAKACKT